jgi:sugar phosphate isomerase/epimerase
MAAGLSAASTTLSAAPAASPIKLGVATYSLRNFQRQQVIKWTKDVLKTPYVSIKEFHLWSYAPDAELARGRAEFERAGLTITGGGTITLTKDTDEDMRFWFEYAKKCGMPMIIAAPSAATLPRVEKFAKEYNIKVAIHNHGPEDKHFPAPQDALKLIKNMDPRMGLCIDVGHTTRTGRNIVETVKECGPRILDMHIKDLADLMDAKSQVEVGDGVMPIPQIFKELVKANYQGHVMLEYEIKADDPLPGMIKSFAYMRGVIAGMTA